MSETFTTGTGQRLVNVHIESPLCHVNGCPIHAPSPEAEAIGITAYWPLINVMARRCEHGVDHPDPDDTRYRQRTGQFHLIEAVYSVHLMKESCDGCCRKARDE